LNFLIYCIIIFQLVYNIKIYFNVYKILTIINNN